MTPTRYPSWRTLGFILGAWNFFGLIATLLVAGSGGPSPFEAMGGRFSSEADGSTVLCCFVFSASLTAAGAAISAQRPALGFLILGAGYVVGAISALILAPWGKEQMVMVAMMATPALGYTTVGVKQLEPDRD